MLEVFAEPKECLADIAMAQWEEASVITVRGTVRSEGIMHLIAGTGTPSLLKLWSIRNAF